MKMFFNSIKNALILRLMRNTHLSESVILEAMADCNCEAELDSYIQLTKILQGWANSSDFT